jgi:hypothetical protein
VTPTILETLDDPQLFAPHFAGPTWGRWRVALAALLGLPMDAEARAIFEHHTERKQPPEMAYREAAWIIGRRGGKSRVLALVAVYIACFRDYSHHLAPGETPVIAILAANRRQARVTLRYVLGFLQHTPLLRPLIARVDDEGIALRNGAAIEVHTATISSPRGRTFAAIIADECAFWWTDSDAANPDVEVLNAVRPGLATLPNSLMLIASSPYARRGALWNAFRRHYGKDDSGTLVWRGTTEEMNHRLTQRSSKRR